MKSEIEEYQHLEASEREKKKERPEKNQYERKQNQEKWKHKNFKKQRAINNQCREDNISSGFYNWEIVGNFTKRTSTLFSDRIRTKVIGTNKLSWKDKQQIGDSKKEMAKSYIIMCLRYLRWEKLNLFKYRREDTHGQRFEKQEITGRYYIVRFRAALFNTVRTTTCG